LKLTFLFLKVIHHFGRVFLFSTLFSLFHFEHSCLPCPLGLGERMYHTETRKSKEFKLTLVLELAGGGTL
jgi:hypothetical protein